MKAKKRTTRTKSSPPRRRAAQRSAARRRWLRYSAMLALFIALGALGFTFHRHLEETRSLYVKLIRIQGASPERDADILKRSGITQKDHIFLLDPDEAARRVETLPYVRHCKVTRIFPDTVVIEVEQRDAVAVLMSGGRLFPIDREGVPIEELPNSAPLPGVFVSGLPGLEVVTPGVPINAPALQEALNVLAVFRSTKMSDEVTLSEIAARHPNDIGMYCDELGFEIRWGRGDLDAQAKRLDTLWAYENGRLELNHYCDLRFGMNVACR